MGLAQTSVAIDDALIEEIVRRVLSVAHPDRIILFGSAATGKMTRDSDIDLLIIDAQENDRRRESVQIGNALRGLGFPFDVLVIAEDWFEASKNVVGGIAYPANKYGRVIYETA
jgi:predicted nucleotidyltransferase